MLRRVPEDVGDDAHGRRWRVDVRIPHHELLENVVLNGPRQLCGLDALFFCRNDVKRQNGQDRSVHRHAHGHAIQRNPFEQALHILNRINRNPRHANVSGNPGMVAVVATVRCQVKRHAQALLARSQIGAVERIRSFRR